MSTNEPRPWLLALTGYAGTGKDTVADMLCELDDNVRRVAFADAVRELTGKLYGLPGDREWWQREKNTPLGAIEVCGKAIPTNKPWWEIDERTRPGILSDFGPNATGTLRDLLIHVGMSLRTFDPDFWLRVGLRSIENYRNAGHPVIVTDCRFTNEAEALTQAGAYLVRVHRPGCEPKGEADRAVDEIPFDLFHESIHNRGTLEDLHKSMGDLLAAVSGPTP